MLTDAERTVCEKLGISEEVFKRGKEQEPGGEIVAENGGVAARLTGAQKTICRQLDVDPEVFLEDTSAEGGSEPVEMFGAPIALD